MGARPYDPAIGRFLEVDPVPGGSLNGYDYAAQDPINGYDLNGQKVCKHLGLFGGLCKKVANGSHDVVTGVEDYGQGSLSVSACVYECVGLVGYHGRIYLQTGEKGVLGGGALWSKQGPYAKSDNVAACVALCVGRSVERGTGNQSYSFGIGTVGVQGGHAKTVPLFKLPWSGYP